MELHNKLLKEEIKGIALWLLTTSLIKAEPESQDLFLSSLTWETQSMGIRKEESAGAAALKPNTTLEAFGAQTQPGRPLAGNRKWGIRRRLLK